MELKTNQKTITRLQFEGNLLILKYLKRALSSTAESFDNEDKLILSLKNKMVSTVLHILHEVTSYSET